MAIEKDNQPTEDTLPETEATVELPGEEGGEAVVAINEDGTTQLNPEVEAESEEDFYSNLAETIDERVLMKLGTELVQMYKSDRESRQDWEDQYVKGLEFLTTNYTAVTKPFQGASTVTHPLLSEAVTQFQAQAFKELLPSEGPVRTQIVGVEDPMRVQQAQRVKDFMNFELMERMEEYVTDFDALLYHLPLAGSAFKKVYYDAINERAVAKFIRAEDLVVPYFANDLMEAERITHILNLTENELIKRQTSGFYRDVDLQPNDNPQNTIDKKYSELSGAKPSYGKDKLFRILEMHVDLDLDQYQFDDNKTEKKVKIPYIVTVDELSGEVLSIYRNYRQEDESVKRIEYFVQYKFLPGLGFYGFGLVHMIGGLTKAATNALRQLLDAGTLANLPAGFKSRGMRVRDDDQPFTPGEFRDVDAPGGNIRDQFQILPFKEPSPTLFQLMGFCVEAGQRFAAISDPQVGDMNSQAPVGTTIALLEKGSRVMSAVQKRCYNAMRKEFKLLARIFADYLPPEYPYDVYGGERTIKAADFNDRVDVLPVADPNIFSMSQRVTLAQTQLQIAQTNPAMHNMHEVYRRIYDSLGTKNIDQILVPEDYIQAPMDPAQENMRAMDLKNLRAFQGQDHDAHIAVHMAFMRTRMVQINPAVYTILQRHITEHISYKARAVVNMQVSQNQQMVALQNQNPQEFALQAEALIAQAEAQMTEQAVQVEEAYTASRKDPLVLLKQRELDIKALEIQQKSQESMSVQQNEDLRFDEKMELEKMKLENKEEADKAKLNLEAAKLQANLTRKQK